MADRSLRRHLSQDEMNRGIGVLHSGLSQRHVANVLGVSQSAVSRMWNRFMGGSRGGTGSPDPPWNFGKNVLIGFVKWYWFDIAQHLCKIQS